MDLQILVVSSDPCDRALLDPLARLPAALGNSFTFRFVDSIAQALHGQRLPGPDLVLVNPDRQLSLANSSPVELLAARFGTVPVIVLCGAAPDARSDSAAVAHIVLAQAPPRLLGEMFLCIVIAARRLHAAATVGGGRSAVLDAIADAVVSTDAAGYVRYLNSAASQLLLLTQREAIGMPIASVMVLQDAATLALIPHPLLETLRTGRVMRLSRGSILVRGDRSEIFIEDSTAPVFDGAGAIGGAVMVFHDVTEAHELQARVDFLAWHDFLTGLPNRFAAQRHLNRILRDAAVRAVPLAVMYLDLDRFKAVNDTLGHAAGDALLVSVSERLRGCFRMIDLVSRQGGDEFVVLMAPGAGRDDATRAAQRMLAAIALPHRLDAAQAHVGCSIGIAMFPEHGASGETLLRHADTALHNTKAAGRNGYRFFTPDMLNMAVQHRQLEEGMRHGLARHEFALHYQPKISLADGRLCGCEALLRWHHPQWGWISPAEFIRSAEDSGMIVPLGQWVLAEAIRQYQSWHGAGYRVGGIAINVSALELRHAGFADHVEECIGTAGLAPGSLQLELTESALMHDLDGSSGILLRLKNLGLSLAIDDFGTGYSSLGYLAELPVDVLKLDRSFVHGIAAGPPRRRTVLEAIIALAQRLALPTVAEGIETDLEAGFLASAGCSQGQGFFYSGALDAGRFEETYLKPAG